VTDTELLPESVPSGEAEGAAAWELSPAGPYLTIRTGGPFDGAVSVTATNSGARFVVEATWGKRYVRTMVSAERIGRVAAEELAQAWADELAAGRQPARD
jgi:hypothetical protein